MNVVSLMCILNLFRFESAEGRAILWIFFEILSFLSLHFFCLVFFGFKKRFFGVFSKESKGFGFKTTKKTVSYGVIPPPGGE